MTSSSHLASSALIYLIGCSVVESPPTIQGVVTTAAGSLLPDIDLPTSAIGRPFFPIASWVNRKIGHRTLTHSFLGIVFFGFLACVFGWALSSWLGAPSAQYAWFLTLGFASHILVDTLNKTGVDLFWPARIRGVFFGNERYRIVSAGRGDYWFMTVCLVANLACYPLARDGFTFSLHQAFGDIYSVSTDFKEYGERNRIWVDLEGVDAISNQKVAGRFEVLAAVDSGAVLIEQGGLKQLVSRTAPLHVFPTRVKIAIGEPTTISTREIQMAGRTLGELPRFPGASRVLYYGYLTPAKLAPLSVHRDRYDSVALRLDKLRLEHAEYRDIEEQDIGHLVIREGTVLAKIHDLPPRLPDPSAEAGQRTVGLVELRVRPDDRLLISEGDDVSHGQPIAVRDVSKQLRTLALQLQEEATRLQADLEQIEIQIRATEREMHSRELERAELERRLLPVRAEPLLNKEADKLEKALVEQKTRLEDLAGRRSLLLSRRTDISGRLQSVAREAAERREIILKEAEIKAGFAGRIVRIIRESAASEITLRISYQTSNPTPSN
ncbi:MAG: metal-dependent hydrolase [Acidobacteriota bacterium]